MEVKQVLSRLRELGLDVTEQQRGGHHRVTDPKTGAFLFNVSSTPGDPNWHWNIARILRRMGLSLQGSKTKQQRGVVNHPIVDLEALRKAQEAAREAGEREPQLEDLVAPIETPEKEKISIMVRAEDKNLKDLRGRLVAFFDERGDELRASAKYNRPNTRTGTGEKAEFVRVARELVGPSQGLRVWKSGDSGQQTLAYFMGSENVGMEHWTRKLITATLDHFDNSPSYWPPTEPKDEIKIPGPLWVEVETDEKKRVENEGPAAVAFPPGDFSREEYVEPDRYDNSESFVNSLKPSYKDRYVEALLKMLEDGKVSDEVVAIEIMPRLDKLLLGEES